MSNEIINGTVQTGGSVAKKATNPATAFRQTATTIATSLLRDWVGDSRAAEATGRIAAALSASAASARDPADFYACTPQSIAVCVATAALTGIMPSTGSCALAYVVPQRARAGEPPQLQYSLSHRGLNALARRSGQTMIAIPIGHSDTIETNATGDISIVSQDLDNPPMTFEELRGVAVIVRELESGVVTCTQWVPKKLIEQRRAMSRSWSGNGRKYSPWENWPVEMAMKTAMHYAISRGWCVIDDADSTKAIATDTSNDVVIEPMAGARLPGPETDNVSQADRVRAAAKAAAAANDPETDTVSELTPPEPEPPAPVDVLFAAIETAKNANELALVERKIEDYVLQELIDSEQAAELQVALDRRQSNGSKS
jgi:recombinational DNA repair protein RecT